MGFRYIFIVFLIAGGLYFQLKDTKNVPAELSSPAKLYPFEEHFIDKQFPEKKFHYLAFERVLNELQNLKNRNSSRSVGSWVVQGPGNIGARVNCISVHPSNEKIIFIGYSDGGVFRTKNGGFDWEPVFDAQTRLAIGDIEFDPQNPEIVYVGTGDPNISGYPFIGDGFYKSTNGGDTWTYSGLKETRIISQIRIPASNPDILYVSSMGIPFEKNTHKGVYKSTDKGVTWNQILFVNDSTGIIDLLLHPTNPDILYAAAWNRVRNNRQSLVAGPDAKIYKTTDGGESWQILQNGSPTGDHSRIGLAMSGTNPDVIFASYTHATNFNLKGIYKSADGGASWNEINISPGSGLSAGNYGGFGWYFGKIRVNPKDDNDIFILGIDLYRTRNGGLNWEQSTPPWWTYEVHADKHDLLFLKDHILLATDGGVYKSEISDTDTWTDIENIPATQFYRVAFNPHSPNEYYGGAQDNGTSGGNKERINEWDRIFGGDGFQPVFHPADPDIFYVETQNGGIAVTVDGGANYVGATSGIENGDPRNWDMPLMMSYHNPDVLYTATDRIYRSVAGAVPDWKSISGVLTDPGSDAFRKNISTIHESPVNPDILYAGTSDSQVWTSKDGGSNWFRIMNGLPGRYVSSIIASHKSEDRVFVSFTGYKDNDFTPHIYISENGGLAWKSIQGNLPPISINSVLVLPDNDNLQDPYDKLIFVATDAGVYWTSDGGANWDRLGNNMPFIPVYDIEYNPINHQIIAGTFARSIQTFDLEQLDITVNTLAFDITPEIKIYPNVTSDAVNIMISSGDSYTITVLNKSGIVMQRKQIDSGSTTLDMSNFPSGLYLLNITFNSKTNFIKKIVKL
ncbi:MAG: T9SS type A sorting domain-containing protein [Saprospiraceae bacterium]|nr:T9SS type A sorting domain-containing protein [Saprospiraceae bacterium]